VPLLKRILSPATQLAVPLDRLATVWPSDVGAKQYVDWLVEAFDLPQRHAIQLCATHLAHPAQVAADCPRMQQLPVTLIQGPPGTGKTHTVLGILNTWHLIQFQRYYDALMQLMKAEAFSQGRGEGAAGRQQGPCSIDQVEPLLERLLASVPSKAHRPRILVCAHSNAATDELLERILREGFRDRGAGVYRPHLLRVGTEAAVSEDAKRVWLESQVCVCGGGGAAVARRGFVMLVLGFE
jgi:senataxin